MVLKAPNVKDDYCMNLLDWGSSNYLALAVRKSVWLWNYLDNSSFIIDIGGRRYATSVSLSNDGRQVAIGKNNSEV